MRICAALLVLLAFVQSPAHAEGHSIDLGLVSQGAPDIALVASSLLASDPSFATDLAAEEAELEDALDGLDLLPFASVGVTFRF